MSTHTTPSHLTFPPACDHNDPHIRPAVSFTRDTAHQPPSNFVDSSISSFNLPARKKGMSKIIKAAPGHLDMSKFVVKTPFTEWANKDMETSRKRRLVLEDRRAAIEETKRDLEERAVIKKRAGQNERQQKHRAKMVQKEIARGIRDDDGNMKKKQKVGEICVPSSCHCR
jgi:hypothetical protein